MEKEFVRNLYRNKYGCIPIIEKDVVLHTYNEIIDILHELYEQMQQKSEREISDNEIEKWAKESSKIEPTGAEEFGRIMGAKWYREQLKNKQ